jgi:diguanylate cyclase (GGDEF)-like protein
MTGMDHAVDDQLLAGKVQFELARVFNDRMVASAYVSPLGIGFIAWLQIEAVGLLPTLVWSALIVSVELLIIGFGKAFRKATTRGHNVNPWIKAQLVCCGLVGLVWGSAAWVVWSPDKFLYHIVVLCVLVGVSFSSIVVMTPMRWAINSFLAGLAIVPLAQLFTVANPIGRETAVGWVVMITIQLWYARQLRGELLQQIENAVRNVLLVDRLKDVGKELARTNSELSLAMGQLNKLVTFDQLTGAYSRHHFMEELERHGALNARHGNPVSLIMLDLDHFKQINDRYGHSVGDRALREAVVIVQAELRDGDMLGRIGGEEFLVLLPMTDREAALILAERLRESLEAVRLVEDAQTIQIPASFGVAELGRNEEVSLWLKRADEALYQAKAAGRNRVAVAA